MSYVNVSLSSLPASSKSIQQRGEGSVQPDETVGAIECIYEQGWTDGLPVVPPAVEKVQAMVETRFNLRGVLCSTHLATPLLILNGPLEELGVNCSHNVFPVGVPTPPLGGQCSWRWSIAETPARCSVMRAAWGCGRFSRQS
jgi:hypothetical protein